MDLHPHFRKGVISAIAKFADNFALFPLLHLRSFSSTPSPPLHLLLPCSISSFSPLNIFGFTLCHHRRAPRPTGHRDRRAPQPPGTATAGHRDRQAPQPLGTATAGHRDRRAPRPPGIATDGDCRGPSWTKVISIRWMVIDSNDGWLMIPLYFTTVR